MTEPALGADVIAKALASWNPTPEMTERLHNALLSYDDLVAAEQEISAA